MISIPRIETGYTTISGMIPGDALTEIGAAFAQCQSRYPTIRLPLERFLQRVDSSVAAMRSGGPIGATEWLAAFRQLHHADLFLAAACAAGDRIAWEFFADEYRPLLRQFAERACRDRDEAEDLAQELVAAMMTGEGARGPRLAGYSGRGTLAAWLRVTVAHSVVDRFRRGRRQVSLEDLESRAPDAEPASPPPPVEATLDARWGPVVAGLLEAELRSLPARERLLLALYYVRGVGLKAIGAHFGVHEATASRWLEQTRRGIRRRIEGDLRRRHGLRRADIEGVWRRVAERDLPALERVLAGSE
jgi:RNA polymerase sigma-70 factor (ECF subfamily)